MIERLRSRFPIDRRGRPLVVTETTQMSGKTMCVATLDLHDGTMVRPLSATGANWTTDDTPTPFTPGAIVTASWARSTGVSPHGNEDARCATKPIKLGECSPAEFFEINSSMAESTVESALGSRPMRAQYIVAGTNCRSLGAVSVRAAIVSIHQNDFMKWRAVFREPSGVGYDIGITALESIETVRQRLAALRTTSCTIVLRIGLARAWSGKPPQSYDPKRCYLQVNGFVFPPDS